MSDSNEEKTIGVAIGAVRKAAGMSLRDLVAKLDIHFTYLADTEKNNRKPSALDLDFDELMAKAGRLGSEAERYLAEHPKFGSLLRCVVRENFDDAQLTVLSEEISQSILRIKNSP